MKQVKRRVWSILLACVMLLTMLPASAWAAEEDVAEVISAGAESGTAYSDLQDAFDAADPGDTVKLLKDTTITPPDEVSPNDELRLVAQIRIQKDLTFDLNGKSIGFTTTNDNLPYYPLLISVENGAHVTFTGNGTIDAECNGNGAYGVDIIGDASLIVQNGTFKGGPSGVQVTKGTLVIYDGFFGVVDGVPSDQWKYAINCIDASFANGTARIYALGGTYCFDPSAKPEASETTYVPEGYTVIREGNLYKVEPADGESAVAKIGNHTFATLAVAASVAKDGDTITMVSDTQLDSAVVMNKELTLDLAGYTITGSASALSAIAVTGNLTITDSTAKEEPVVSPDYETVDYEAGKIEIASSKGAAVSVQEGGQLTVEGGILKNTRNIGLGVHGNSDPETWSNHPIDSTATINGGLVLAQEYGIGVYGNGAVLNVNDGVISTVDNAAVAGNGSCNADVNYGGTTIHISGGTLIGHITTPGYIANGIYHPQSGVLDITGGTIYADNGLGVLMRNGELNVSENATIIATGDESGQVGDHPADMPGNAVVIDFTSGYNHNNETNDTRKVSISGGCFGAEQETITVGTGDNNKDVTSFVTGGSFSKQPDASYIADGCVVVNSGDANYPYLIQKAETVGKAKAVAEVADPSVDDSRISDLTEEQKKEVVAAAESVEVSSDVMQEQSKTALDEVKEDSTIVDDAIEALNTQLGEELENAEGVTLFVQAYLDITPTEYKPEEQTLTFDITPMSRVVASTEKDSEKLVIKGEETSDGPANAVIVGEPKPLTVNRQVTITLTLPGSFNQETVYVVHTKEDGTQYLYDGTVDGNKVLTFTNPNGFSDFTVYGADPAAARVYANGEGVGTAAGTGYLTLQEAVNAVKNGGYIVVKRDGKAVVSESKSFTVENGMGYDISIEPGSRYEMTEEPDENGCTVYTFTRAGGGTIVPSIDRGPSLGSPLPVAGSGSTPSVTGFTSDTNADLTVNGRYQFRITSLDSHTPVLTVNNANFTVSLASRSGNDYFYVITCAGTPGSTAAVSVDGKYLLTATVGGSASGVVSDTTHPFTVAQGGTYQFRLTAAARPSFAAGSASFTVEYAGQEGNDYFYKVHAVGQAGDGCGFYINGEAQPVAVATIG